MEWIQTVDHAVLLWIAAHIRQDWLTPIVTVITSLGNAGAVWLILALIFLIGVRTRRWGAAMLVALVFGLLVGNLWLKNWIARPRPFHTYSDIMPLVIPGDLYSFPSGHTLSSFCAATACFAYSRRAGLFCYLLAALIGLSRLYMGVHYPSDVLAGALLGIGLGMLAVWVVNQVADRIRFGLIRR